MNRLTELSYEIMKFDQSNIVVNNEFLDDDNKFKDSTVGLINIEYG